MNKRRRKKLISRIKSSDAHKLLNALFNTSYHKADVLSVFLCIPTPRHTQKRYLTGSWHTLKRHELDTVPIIVTKATYTDDIIVIIKEGKIIRNQWGSITHISKVPKSILDNGYCPPYVIDRPYT